jgi:hypothetical protein
LGVLGVKETVRFLVSRTKKPKEGSSSRKRLATFELFETLESGCNDGLVQRYGKAHERRPFFGEAKTRGEKSSEGQKAERGSAGGTG